MIVFQYNGRAYQTSDEAYDGYRILLDNGTLLVASAGWSETAPPVP